MVWSGTNSAGSLANVDEVFIDLCRQIIRRDNNHSSQDYDDEANSPTEKKHKRRRFGRCVIL
jgi:Ras-related protein Rap-1B